MTSGIATNGAGPWTWTWTVVPFVIAVPAAGSVLLTVKFPVVPSNFMSQPSLRSRSLPQANRKSRLVRSGRGNDEAAGLGEVDGPVEFGDGLVETGGGVVVVVTTGPDVTGGGVSEVESAARRFWSET